jgi:hypothetical protein
LKLRGELARKHIATLKVRGYIFDSIYETENFMDSKLLRMMME